MRRFSTIAFTILLAGFFTTCSQDKSAEIASVEDRVSEAKSNLLNDLIAPANGWRLEYQPSPNSGIFLILLEFEENGDVVIKSDVAENNGEYYDHTIPYRIDSGLGLELILETYGVFHDLFELNSASFGGEFEFLYIGKEGSNLVFQSASDVGPQPTILTFIPAGPDDENDFSRDIAENLNAFQTKIPQVFEENPSPIQQIIFEDENISLFWELNPAERTIYGSFAGVGSTIEEISNSGIGVTVDQFTGYTMANGSLILLEPISFVLTGRSYTINSIAFGVFELNGGPNFCTLTAENVPKYNGQIAGIGAISMVGSLFDINGTAFQPIEEFPYSVSIPFLYDGGGNSLADPGGIIAEKFPEATGFVFHYGFQSADQPAYAAGFILENEDGTSDVFVQEYDSTATEGNRISLNFTNNFYHSGVTGTNDEDDLAEITSLIFSGVDQYAFDFPVDGVQVFKLYNPCNGYEVFLVGN